MTPDRRTPHPPLSWVERVGEGMTRYRLVLWVLVALVVAMGFDFRTPAAQFRENRSRTDTLGRRVDSVVRSLGTRDLINIGVARYLCFKDPDAARLFLPCSYLGSGTPPP